jgi:hypothetical protein
MRGSCTALGQKALGDLRIRSRTSTVLFTMIKVDWSYVPFWLLGAMGIDRCPNSSLK